MNEFDWHDATPIDSAYEIQIDDRGNYRHRKLNFDAAKFEPRGTGQWRRGHPEELQAEEDD